MVKENLTLTAEFSGSSTFWIALPLARRRAFGWSRRVGTPRLIGSVEVFGQRAPDGADGGDVAMLSFKERGHAAALRCRSTVR